MEVEDDQSSLKEKEIARDRDAVFISSYDESYSEETLKSYMDENRINLCVIISSKKVEIIAKKKRADKAKNLQKYSLKTWDIDIKMQTVLRNTKSVYQK